MWKFKELVKNEFDFLVKTSTKSDFLRRKLNMRRFDAVTVQGLRNRKI